VTQSPVVSGCEACCDGGDCSAAFKGTAGRASHHSPFQLNPAVCSCRCCASSLAWPHVPFSRDLSDAAAGRSVRPWP
jgi:hypothetical protein